MDKMERFINLISDKYKERFSNSSEDSDLNDLDNLQRKSIFKDSD
jgi:hypothetical protein